MYVQPSMTSTVAGVVAAISRPASTGPASCVSWLAPDRTALTLATACSSSPATSGTTSRDEAKYGAAKIPIANVVASSAANERCPVLCRIGMTSISGPRAASEMSIVFFAPSFAITVPAGMPKIAIGSISTASAKPIFAVEPVVMRTKNGSATNVIDEPVNETSSAVSSPTSERFFHMAGQNKTYVRFCQVATISPVPKVTQEHLDARRAEILDGARRAFAEHGYEGATVARLEEATGLSRGAIFHYFENKNDLFVELAMEMNTRFGDILIDAGLHDAFRALAAESPEWLAVLIETESRMRHDDDFVRRFEAKAADTGPRIQEWFEQQQAEGKLRADVSWLELGRFTTAVLNGLALRIAGGDPFDVEAMLQLLDSAIAAPRKPRKVNRPRQVAKKR